MRCRGKLIVVTIAILAIICLCADHINHIDVKKMFSVSVQKEQNSVLIIPWIDSEDHLYVILPSYAELSSTNILTDEDADIIVDGQKINAEMNCAAYQLEVPYQFTYKRLGKRKDYMLTFLKSASVPTMYIDTESGNLNYIHGKKRNAESGRIHLYGEDGELQYEGNLKSIAGRGNTTWDNYEKKAYTIDLGEEHDLLGMGAARDWVLLANATDPSHMRNKIVYDFANQAGLQYSPESDWVDLYLNGAYAGLYLLTEQNEVHAERIAINNENSFLVSKEGRGRMVTQNLPYIETDQEQVLRVRYPKNPTEEQLQGLTKRWNDIEKAIMDMNGTGNENGAEWDSLIDVDTWVRKYLIEEIFGSLDACYMSQYFYYDGNYNNSRVMAGPVWDFDLSMGRTWHTESLDFLWANRLHVDDKNDTPWFYELYKKDAFLIRVKAVFEEEMLPLLETLCEKRISDYHGKIKQAAQVNQIRWKTESYDEEIALLKAYVSRRMDFLTKIWIEERAFHLIKASSEGESYAYFAVEDGGNLLGLPVIESSESRTFKGWFTENGEPVNEAAAIYEDCCIYAQWDGSSNKMSTYVPYLLPLAVIAFMGVLILMSDILRMRKYKHSR